MTQRNELIDFIRGFSILTVILLHCKIHLPINNDFLSITWVKWLLESGYYGVMIFFVVSGFLITQACFKRWHNLQSIQLNQFYLMRFARIIPCLMALLIILSLLHLLKFKDFIIQNTSLEQAIFSALTFQINWLEVKIKTFLPANWDVLWSLSIEEMFYLFFPLLCIFLRKQKYLIGIMLVFILIGPFARTVFYSDDLWSDRSYLSCMDGIAIGCLAAMIAVKVRSKGLLVLPLITGCLLFSLAFFCRKQVSVMGISAHGLNVTMLEIGIALIIISTRYIQFKWFKIIRWFGRNSYEIYLTHSFMVMFAMNFLYNSNQPTWLITIEYLFVVVCSGLLGQAVAKYYSESLNRYIRENKYIEKINYADAP